MKKLSIFIYGLLLLVLTGATFFEAAFGKEMAHSCIYGAWWFVLLWALLGMIGSWMILGKRLWKRLPSFMIHTSLLLILIGAAITFFGKKDGYVSLQKGEMVQTYWGEEQGQMLCFDSFALRLDSFQIEYYPGTFTPAQYISRVSVFREAKERPESYRLSMNRILKVDGYRFYQQSYHNDLTNCVFRVNNDPWGIAVSYAGYLLFGCSVLMLLFFRRSTFRELLSHPLLKGGLAGLLMLGWTGCSTTPTDDGLSQTAILYQGRVCPFNTMAQDFMLKLYGKTTYQGFQAEQVVEGILSDPERWRQEPIFRIKNKLFAQELGLRGRYTSLEKLQAHPFFLEKNTYSTSIERNFQKDIAQMDEKMALFEMLCKGHLFSFLPENDLRSIDPKRLRAELYYHRFPINTWLSRINTVFGLLAFALSIYRLNRTRKKIDVKRFVNAQVIISLGLLIGYTLLRWYISGHVPLSNGYETLIFAAICILFVSFLGRKKWALISVSGLLLSGIVLMVSSFGSSNPQITSLVPVLMSPWLSSHVSLIMISYVLFGFIAINSLIAIILHYTSPHSQKDEVLQLINKLLLYPAVGCLGMGIFIGAIWANVSWGQYWGWDPKEVWALITFMCYAIAFHDKSLRWLQTPLYFHWFCLLALLTVIMTYFGVNVLFSGLHSYSNLTMAFDYKSLLNFN